MGVTEVVIVAEVTVHILGSAQAKYTLGEVLSETADSSKKDFSEASLQSGVERLSPLNPHLHALILVATSFNIATFDTYRRRDERSHPPTDYRWESAALSFSRPAGICRGRGSSQCQLHIIGEPARPTSILKNACVMIAHASRGQPPSFPSYRTGLK